GGRRERRQRRHARKDPSPPHPTLRRYHEDVGRRWGTNASSHVSPDATLAREGRALLLERMLPLVDYVEVTPETIAEQHGDRPCASAKTKNPQTAPTLLRANECTPFTHFARR